MEYLEGETVAQRLKKGALPLDQALRVATQIADALDKAHRRGIVHRDLKPGNIMLTKAGAKLLDFGLAKLRDPKTAAASLSQRPTESAALTGVGKILGTLQYMAPEQLEGKEADARTDLFAFGAMVYEMTTGQRAFNGDSQASLIASILDSDPPPISALQPLTPPALDRVVKKCLAKDPEDRWQDARDVTGELQWIGEGGGQAGLFTGAVAPQASGWRRAAPFLGAGLGIAIVSGFAVWTVTRSSAPPSPPMGRFSITLPPNELPVLAGLGGMAVSPDGTQFVYVADVGEVRQLVMRHLDQLGVQRLSGTEGAFLPFFSPDGQWVGFFARPDWYAAPAFLWRSAYRQEWSLKKVTVAGGAPVTVVENVMALGASWGEDDMIVFGGPGLHRISATGGVPERLTPADEEAGERYHGFPSHLRGSNDLFFSTHPVVTFNPAATAWITTDSERQPGIDILSLDTGERQTLADGALAMYLPTGHVVVAQRGPTYGTNTALVAPFDADRLELTGPLVPILDNLRSFSVSNAGTLVSYGGRLGGWRRLLLVDRQGRVEPLAEPALYESPRFSPDGADVAVSVGVALLDMEPSHIAIYDVARQTRTRLTFQDESGPGVPGAYQAAPVWSLDGQRVVFSSAGPPAGAAGLFWKAADGAGPVQRLTRSSPGIPAFPSWSPDGTLAALFSFGGETSWNIDLLSTDGEPSIRPLLHTPFEEMRPAISPNGDWMAYDSNESGRREVYVRPFPDVEAGKEQVSSDGGTEPVWGPTGRELFYRSGDAMMAVRVGTEPTFTPGNPEFLFAGRYHGAAAGRSYDIAPDGQRFVMIEAAEPGDIFSGLELVVVLNWFEELNQRVPVP